MENSPMECRILNALLDRYERSRHFREGTSAKKIQVIIDKDADFAGLQYDADTKELLFDALNALKRDGLIDFSWVRYEKGNLAERFWLITQEEYLVESYRRVKRTPRKESLEEMEELLEETIAFMNLGDPRLFLERMLAEIREKKRMLRFFFDSKDAADGRRSYAGKEAESKETARKEAAEKNRRLLYFLREPTKRPVRKWSG